MPKRKLSEAETEALMADYYAWDKYNPNSETAEELAARHGISKPTMYNIIRRYERERGDKRRAASVPTPANAEDLQAVIRYLTEELIAARVRIAELEKQVP